MNHKLFVVGLRWLTLVLAFGMIQADIPAWFSARTLVAVFALYGVSNLILSLVPGRFLEPSPAWFGLVVLDIVAVSTLVYGSGFGNGDAFFLYLPVIVWASCHQGMRGSVVALTLALAAYLGQALLLTPYDGPVPDPWGGGELIWRTLLLAVLGVLFGYLSHRLRMQIVGKAFLLSRQHDLEQVVAATHSLSATLDHGAALTQLVREIGRLVPTVRCSVIHVDETRCVGTILVSRQTDPSHAIKIDLANYPEIGFALKTRHPVVINDVAGSDLMRQMSARLTQLGIHALLVVPVTVDDPLVGTLLLSMARTSPPFSAWEVDLCQLVAAVSANVFKNAYLHESLADENLSLQRLAVTDALTGLYNRRFFNVRLAEEFRLAGRHALPLSCIIIDVDYFKRINDTHGHPVGDEVLVEVGRAIQLNMRYSDCLARYGGEEFVVLLPLTDRDGALAKAEGIRLAIKELLFAAGDQRFRINVSIGVATADPETMPHADFLVGAADHALYLAKQGGRDQVRYYQAQQTCPLLTEPASHPHS